MFAAATSSYFEVHPVLAANTTEFVFLKNDKKNSLNEMKMSLPIKIGEAKFGIVVEIKTAELCYEKWRLSTIV